MKNILKIIMIDKFEHKCTYVSRVTGSTNIVRLCIPIYMVNIFTI